MANGHTTLLPYVQKLACLRYLVMLELTLTAVIY